VADTALFQLTELAAFVQSDLDTATAQVALDMAQGLIQHYTGQTLLYVDGSVWTVPDDPRGLERRLAWLPGLDTTYGRSDLVIPLPEQPVTAVSAVNGLAANVGFRLFGGQLLVSSTALWTWPLTVTYSHGFQSIPADLKAVGLRLAAKLLSNPSGLRSETIGGYSYTTAGGEPGFSDFDRLILNDYRRRSRSLAVTTID
jgi:hypothetical protein